MSARWTGKVQPLSTEVYTLIVDADEGVRLWWNHTLVVDRWDACCDQTLVVVPLTANYYYDIKIEWRELLGSASIRLQWKTPTLPQQVIPKEQLYQASHIVGSPFSLQVLPGSTDFPYTTVTGPGLDNAIAGDPTSFIIQAKDQNNNNKTSGYDEFSVALVGPAGQILAPEAEPLGNGRYLVTYTAFTKGTTSCPS